MTETVLDIRALPKTIFSMFTTKKVNFYEENGTITLTPFPENKTRLNHFFGIFSNNGNAEKKLRAAWIEKLETAADKSTGESLPLVGRSSFMRNPILLTDEA